MNLRCLYCQTPFTLNRAEMLTAIVTMNEKNLNHYDAHCPRCRRANSISRQRMELFFPNWRDAAKQMASAPASPPPPVPASASLKTEPLSKAVRKAALKISASKTTAAEKAKPSASKRKRASKPATVKKTTTASSKPAPAKKTTSKSAAKKSTTAKTTKKTTTKSSKK